MRLVSTFGMGVLMGTSLVVIIPEGVETLYSIPSVKAARQRVLRPPDKLIGGNVIENSKKDGYDIGSADNALKHIVSRMGFFASDDNEQADEGKKPETTNGRSSVEVHQYIGVSLISGFVFMLLLDKIPEIITQLSSNGHYSSVDVSELRTYSVSTSQSQSSAAELAMQRAAASTTTGLIIHAIADGIALGASAASSNIALEAMVFFALMLHKAPAAFAMSAVLLRTGMSKRNIRQNLLGFSLAAPIGAITTWIIILIVGTESSTGIQWWTGILLLFSAGTFL